MTLVTIYLIKSLNKKEGFRKNILEIVPFIYLENIKNILVE